MPPRSVPSALRPAVREHARPAVPQPHQHQQLNTSARSPAFSSPASPHSNLSIANRHTPGLQLRRNKHFPIANMTTNTNKGELGALVRRVMGEECSGRRLTSLLSLPPCVRDNSLLLDPPGSEQLLSQG